MKKIISAVLIASLALSLCSCSGNTTSSGDTSASADSSESTPGDAVATGSFATNPVKVDENGKVDMQVALAYETDFDALLAKLEAKTPTGDELVSENSNEETKQLFKFLKECYGKKLIAGQQDSDKNHYEDLAYYNVTGDLPAIKGFDFLFAVGGDNNDDQMVDDAIEWHDKMNGIVTFCWHWKVPIDIDSGNYNAIAFYSDEIKNFSLKNAVTPGTKEYEVVIKDIDTVAIKLQRLEEAGVPVLWRPLHEASGNWFWWGVKDKETLTNQYYQKLWYMIFDRLENYHKLTNLIWVWNGQSKKAAVNENTFDIAGIDVYPNSEDHSEQARSYETLKKLVTSDKMLALSECGYIPDPELVLSEDNEVKWLYYCPWNYEFIYNYLMLGGTPQLTPERMSEEFLKKVYGNENVVTLGRLPDLDGNNTKILPNHIEMWMINNPTLKLEKDALADYERQIIKK